MDGSKVRTAGEDRVVAVAAVESVLPRRPAVGQGQREDTAATAVDDIVAGVANSNAAAIAEDDVSLPAPALIVSKS